jgi:uncharacterized membrane protein YtjA (UPF0391 family)
VCSDRRVGATDEAALCGTYLSFAELRFAKAVQGALVMGNLLHYAIVFLIVALVAAFLGFGGVAGTAMEGARILFWVAIVLFVVSLVAGWIRRV